MKVYERALIASGITLSILLGACDPETPARVSDTQEKPRPIMPEFSPTPHHLEHVALQVPDLPEVGLSPNPWPRASFSDLYRGEEFSRDASSPYQVEFDNSPGRGSARFLVPPVIRWHGHVRPPMSVIVTAGGGRDTKSAVLEALRWLARHQNRDGSWSVKEYTRRCTKPCTPNPGSAVFRTGVTALSLIAFLGRGYSHLSRDTYDGLVFGDVVQKGLQWLLKNQDAEGCIGSRQNEKYMYNHAIATAALADDLSLTGSLHFRAEAQRALDFLVAAQNPGRGWRYSFRCGDNDSSVTGWAMVAFKSAEYAGLTFSQRPLDGILSWYDEVTDNLYGRVAYTALGTSARVLPTANENFDYHETMTAIGGTARCFITRDKRDPRMHKGTFLLLRDLPKWDGNAIDFYYWHWATLALFHYDGPSGPKWEKWNTPMKRALLSHQNGPKTGCTRGSWEPVGSWCHEGGRVYATAINALTLESYYRYPMVFGRSRGW